MLGSTEDAEGTRRALLAGTGLLGAVLLLGGRTMAQESAPAATEGGFADRIRDMRAGDYVWLPELAPDGPILLVVSIRAQRAIVYRNGIPIGVSTVSTGKAGHETPTGVFTILQKDVDHASNLYDSAPMPFMQRLTWDGIALHAGNLPGYPASHGCVRLPIAFARILYGVTRLGMTVLVSGEEAVPRIAPTPDFLDAGRRANAAPAPDDATEWVPAAAPTGPVSIVVSAADRRIIVLRNGVRIGTAPVEIAGAVTGLGVYALAGIEDGEFRWLDLGSGGGGGAGRAVSSSERARLRLPDLFQTSLRAILQPGVIAIVTPDSLAAASSGQELTVVDADEGAK
ncbi:L,D-transpeptidase [Sphingomonas sanxanigenens]|uniref:L,D-TPase catalytic domain-containing protein n=1 Tax=Sphingomonas sanxanigenens DSM 19645 = NX02 TaxID=1123269 RepID=W0AJG5_9SPHN|nr:L,D-transpeptidase [Sphingomonas sanxanigenens]AHE55810.1 hypothetical protein NX02_20845 [Sphingomonas sanxanigenens DSM 19645 = NX02]